MEKKKFYNFAKIFKYKLMATWKFDYYKFAPFTSEIFY